MLTDVPEPQLTQAEADALIIRREMANLTGHASHVLARIKEMAADPDHRAAIVAELGPADAQDLKDAFDAYRQAVQAANRIDVGALEG